MINFLGPQLALSANHDSYVARCFTSPVACMLLTIVMSQAVFAEQRVVSNNEELASALEAAAPGDEIVLQPGTYTGGVYREGLRQVIIRSADPAKQAVIEGGDYGLMLSDAVDVTIANLTFRKQAGIGINIDDAESHETPSSGIKLLNVTVRDMSEAGNHDGIKLSGVKDFLIDGCRVENWGNDGSAIDFVGSHYGLVQNCWLRHKALEIGGSGIRPKGGAKFITIRANRIELPIGNGRAIQAGGSTDSEYFRFVDGDSNYEARGIVMEGNVIIGSGAPFSWVNIDGGIAHHNLVHRPGQWVIRVLNENPETDIVDTRNGQFHDNVVVINDTDEEFNEAVNSSDETHPESFIFARNQWFNISNPTLDGSKPALPAEEVDGVYGQKPSVRVDAPQVWEFPWGMWIVNANPEPMAVDIADAPRLRRAIGAEGSQFKPLYEQPLEGRWQLQAIANPRMEVPPFSQVVLIRRK